MIFLGVFVFGLNRDHESTFFGDKSNLTHMHGNSETFPFKSALFGFGKK